MNYACIRELRCSVLVIIEWDCAPCWTVLLVKVERHSVVGIFLVYSAKLTAMAVDEKLQKVVRDLLLCYGEADSLMLCSSAEPQVLKPIMKSINELSVELDFIAVDTLAVIDEARRKALLSQIEEIRYQKAKFEDKVVKWLFERSLSKSDIDDIVHHGPTLRSTVKSRRTSRSGLASVKSGSSGHSNSSSVLRAKAIAKQELARLRIAQ